MVMMKIQKMELQTNIWGWHPSKGDHSTPKRMPNLLVEEKAKTYYDLKMMTKLKKKHRQVERI